MKQDGARFSGSAGNIGKDKRRCGVMIKRIKLDVRKVDFLFFVDCRTISNQIL